jgi:uncharacterized protein YodC (DUF2158 family)
MAFNVGDVVQLKSSGPLMTVESIDDDGVHNCTWFQERELKKGHFPEATLKLVPSAGEPRSAIPAGPRRIR